MTNEQKAHAVMKRILAANTTTELEKDACEVISNLLWELKRDKWLPIESAPKDGTRILLLSTGWSSSPDGRQEVGMWDLQPYHKKPCPYWSYESWVGRKHISTGHPPTHWMHLPQPPKEQGQ